MKAPGKARRVDRREPLCAPTGHTGAWRMRALSGRGGAGLSKRTRGVDGSREQGEGAEPAADQAGEDGAEPSEVVALRQRGQHERSDCC